MNAWSFCSIFFLFLTENAVSAAEDAVLKSKPELVARETEDVCFAPAEPCTEKLRKFIASGKISVDIAVYDLNLDEIADAILAQSKKIVVRVLVDPRMSVGRYSLVKKLKKNGVNIHYGKQRGAMHHKSVLLMVKPWRQDLLTILMAQKKKMLKIRCT